MSDPAWISEKPYDSTTGEDAIGVEFAGTAVTDKGFDGTISSAEAEAATYKKNEEMKWTEGYYRGYYELVQAKYFAALLWPPAMSRIFPWPILPLKLARITAGCWREGRGWVFPGWRGEAF